MSLKMFTENRDGFTYTIEAILGVFLVMGTVMFAASNLPSVAHETGDFSKVQLVNIGRDTLDLIAITPIYETCPNCLEGIVNRSYLLVADKTFVMVDEPVNFTVYYLSGVMVDKPLTLYQTILGQSDRTPIKNITGTTSYSWAASSLNASEFTIQAADSYGFSNYVTIKVGYYYLDTDTNGIYINADDTNVTGLVYNSSGGVPDLTIKILDENYVVRNASATKTISGKLIENFDDHNNWSTSGNKANNITNKIEGSASMSVNSTSGDFWISKPLTQVLDKFDFLSFYFYSNTGNELITVELQNGTSEVPSQTTARLVPKNWTKINTRINVSTAIVIDSIKIRVSNINTEDYLFDNMTVGDGKFSFEWPTSLSTGRYYINATDGIYSSNMHLIVYSEIPGNAGSTLWQDSTIFETGWVDLYETDRNGNIADIQNTNNFFINEVRYGDTSCSQPGTNYSLFYPACPDKTRIRFTASVAGDYYIFEQTPNGRDIKTNSIVIHVLPLMNAGPTADNCVDKNELNRYMRNYTPPYVNYNLYLINSSGNRFTGCPKFDDGELINGYPTSNAVTVNKFFHIKYRDINEILELRMILWYK